jgi:feruloyl esterase
VISPLILSAKAGRAAAAIAALALLTFTAQARAAGCEALATSLHLPHITITLAEAVAPGAFKPPGPGGGFGTPPGAFGNLPAFCRLAGTARPTPDSDIRFEVWMPASGWNGKFVGVGNGVWAGSIGYFEMTGPLSRGYATAATDDGHQGNPLDASFAAGHPEKLIDFGHRAVHEMTVAAKAAVAAYYQKPPSRSLFASCSTGGRQALMEAYRYPQDYNAISSMAPANPMTALMVSSLWTGYAVARTGASRIPPAKFTLVHKAAVAACDADDGVKDGIISAPERCHFDPAVLACKGDEADDCLTKDQIEALRAIYQGPRDPATGRQIFAGFMPGSEQMFPLQTGPQPFGAAFTYMRDLVFKNPQWDFKSFDYGSDSALAVKAGAAILDVPPDGLGKFFGEGRKLLLSHGWADGLIPSLNTVGFYKDLTQHLGARKAGDSVRLFMIPGMGHCAGGEGPFVADMVSVIDQWAQDGKPPERIVVSNPPGAPPRTRPLCPYPKEAVYSGSGSTDEEQNFRCGLPDAAAPGHR